MTVKTAMEALALAAQQFRTYEGLHRAKGTADAHEKAETNRQMAEMCEAALERNGGTFQARVGNWMLDCFTPEIAEDRVERGDRFLEEVFELLQWMGYDPARIDRLRAYVWGRPVGEGPQEVGGVMVCLAALCNAVGISLGNAAETELERINDPATMAKIRAKQAAKPPMSPEPVAIR
jgi:hypothetical protein